MSTDSITYMKAEHVGGPRDGLISFVTVPPPDTAYAYARDSHGREWKCAYRRDPHSEGEAITFELAEFRDWTNVTDLLAIAFASKRAVRYLAIEHAPAWMKLSGEDGLGTGR